MKLKREKKKINYYYIAFLKPRLIGAFVFEQILQSFISFVAL